MTNRLTAGRWHRNAACRTALSPDIFFADPSQKADTAQAKNVCRRCPVSLTCLIDRMQTEVSSARYGVYGGATTGQRRQLADRMRNTGETLQTAAQVFIDRLHREDDPFGEAYAARTEALDDGHVRWTIASSSVAITGRQYSPMQVAFVIAHGREANGTVRAHCGMAGCVALDHISDTAMRKAARRAAAA